MKLGQWVIMLLTMMVVLQFMGIPTGIESTLNTFGVNITAEDGQLVKADIGDSGFWKVLFADEAFNILGISFTGGILLILLGGGAIIVGLFARSYDVSLVILPLVVFVAGIFISTFWSVIKYVQDFGESWATGLIATIFIALGVGFVWACVDYFAGR